MNKTLPAVLVLSVAALIAQIPKGATVSGSVGSHNHTDSSYVLFIPAVCQNATASLAFSTPTADAATPICVTGTNSQYGVASFADGASQSVQTHLSLPLNWTGAIDVNFRWRTSATTGDVEWGVETACVADGETGDPAWNAASTIVDTAKGTTLQWNDALASSITTTGCTAGEEMLVKLSRTHSGSDTLAATAELISVRFTVRRTI